MDESKLFVVTGGAGFIGSNIVKALNEKGMQDIIIVDHLSHNKSKKKNLTGLGYKHYLDRDEFLKQIQVNTIKGVDVVIHLGARTDTIEKDKDFLLKNNTLYSKYLYNFCVRNGARFIYASSGATYGDGSRGYSDRERKLKPLNYYGLSKYLFDEWMLDQKEKLSQWVGLKFFNVYGPNEYHKGFMASVVYHCYNQVKKNNVIRLFKSYRKEYRDGEQKRDFVYVRDAVNVILFFLNNTDKSGIFNVGTGKARTFLDLAHATFQALHRKPNIEFIDMPGDLKDKYQYFTQADISRLRDSGYREKFYGLEDGVYEYVQKYLDYTSRKPQ